MKITLFAIGTRGDVQPMVALGAALDRGGHSVRLVAGDEFRSMGGVGGIDFVSLGSPFAELMRSSSLSSFVPKIRDIIVAEASARPDAMISTFLGLSSLPVARRSGVPFFYVLPVPSLRTKAFPSPVLVPFAMPGPINRLTHHLTERFVFRAWPAAKTLLQEPRPVYLFCHSRHVVPRPDDWGDFAHVTGYWFWDRAQSWQPPPDLREFLSTDEAPIAVCFGSTPKETLGRVPEIVVQAVLREGYRAVFVGLSDSVRNSTSDPRLFFANSIPHDWLFPRVRAVIHHGGAGTVAESLRAGIPSIVIPFALDQPFWAFRLSRLGVAPAPIYPKNVSAGLDAAISQVLENTSFAAAARELGDRINQEDGVNRAIEIIEQVTNR